MTDRTKIYNGILKVIWGYFFLYFDFFINIGNGKISLIPKFVGFILFLKAIDLLKDIERELSLLKPLGIILGVWQVIEWLANCVGYSFDGKLQFINLIIGLLNLYFHFQFITNLASIATKHQREGCVYDKKLLTYRTILTILQTVFIVFTILNFIPDEVLIYITLALGIVFVIVCIGMMIVLNQLRNNLKYDEEITDDSVTDDNIST